MSKKQKRSTIEFAKLRRTYNVGANNALLLCSPKSVKSFYEGEYRNWLCRANQNTQRWRITELQQFPVKLLTEVTISMGNRWRGVLTFLKL